jgi:hypothetical protein
MKRKKLVISVVIAVIIMVLILIGLSHRGQNKGTDASEYTNTIKDSSTESSAASADKTAKLTQEYTAEAEKLWDKTHEEMEYTCTKDEFVENYVAYRLDGDTPESAEQNLKDVYSKDSKVGVDDNGDVYVQLTDEEASEVEEQQKEDEKNTSVVSDIRTDEEKAASNDEEKIKQYEKENTDKRAGTYTDADGVKHNQFIDDDGRHYYLDINGSKIITDTIESEEDFYDFLDEIDHE